MANKLKKTNIPAAVDEEEKPTEKSKSSSRKKAANGSFKKDKEEKVDLKKLARDERTWKIVGTASLLVSIFLFIAFVSYFFTWKEDSNLVNGDQSNILWEDDIQASNLLGRLGAYISHFFIFKGFGVASLLFCTFFAANHQHGYVE